MLAAQRSINRQVRYDLWPLGQRCRVSPVYEN
jgi:hypothetical protein